MPWISLWTITWLLAWTITAVAASTPEHVSSDDYDATAFQSQFNRCPVPCLDESPEDWSVYSSFERLSQCDRPMLFDLAIHTPINDKKKSVLIRACTTSTSNKKSHHKSDAAKRELDACRDSFVQTKVQLHVSRDVDKLTTKPREGLIILFNKMKDYAQSIVATTGCSKESDVMLGYFDGSVVGIYAGRSLASATVPPMIDHLFDQYKYPGYATSSMLTQICGHESDMDHTAGVAVSLEADIDYVQSALLSWNQGECASKPNIADDGSTYRDLTIHQVPLPAAINSVAQGVENVNSGSKDLGRVTNMAEHLDAQVNGKYCTMHKIAVGDTCASIAKTCKISVANFLKYNDVKGDGNDFCRKLQAEKNICCSSGSSKPLPEDNGGCYTYTIKANDECSTIGAPWNLTPKDIEGFNNKITWGWRGCPNLTVGLKVCLSKGSPPMPAPISNAVCGPQKPGTVNPGQVKDASTLAKLNPCPLNSCCNIWGQCGIDSLFCTKADGPTGNPGTAPPRANGCISNCGTDIVNNDKPPSNGFKRVGYYEAFNWERSCLHMRSEMSNTQKYTHMHWAFGDVKSDMSVSINDTYGQWYGFMGLKDVKKIVSFGGWGFSTGVESYEVLRKAMSPESRDRFISNVVSFAKEANVDGIDFDWEYPGAPDIPGIPKGLPSDGPNYLNTLRALRKALPARYSLSIAVPASYWYLRPFPIQEMSQVVDYIVYMAYDLHGQWDVGNGWAMSGCPSGNCLRSHINQTEVVLALSMITKAGVNANKVFVGESSYGRSFRMSNAGCTGPDCTFTGANGQSNAAKGRCTNASGYLSNAEISEIISKSSKSKRTWFDKDTASDYLLYNDVEWVAYMSDKTKEIRRDKWKKLNFGGSVDWAVDLQEFNVADTVGPHGQYNNASCIQVFDNMIWDWLNPSIEAVAGCTNILQPSPLPTAVTLTAYTTITLQSGTSLSTTVVSASFSISEVSYQPFTFNESHISTFSSGQMLTYNPTPRITPNPVTIGIPTGWTVTGVGKATGGNALKEPSVSIIGLPQMTSTSSSDHGIGFLLPITWLPTVSYKIPSILTPKPPAPTELPDDDENPIINAPTPPGVVDCKDNSCTKGQDFDCEVTDMTFTTTIKSSTEEPDPTYIAKIIEYEGMKLMKDKDLLASIGKDEDEFFSLLESPTTTTLEISTTSEITSTPSEEASSEPTQTPEVTCGIALYPRSCGD
ncbi:hypothetical protein TrVFT333_004615 [Trichoderma virens FT-333]|nr:hypothetical protein TrVFT333_004615 [Trichoderma virens FT-333]